MVHLPPCTTMESNVYSIVSESLYVIQQNSDFYLFLSYILISTPVGGTLQMNEEPRCFDRATRPSCSNPTIPPGKVTLLTVAGCVQTLWDWSGRTTPPSPPLRPPYPLHRPSRVNTFLPELGVRIRVSQDLPLSPPGGSLSTL